MRRSPSAHARRVAGVAEVILVGRLGQPACLTGRFAGATASRCRAVLLVATVPIIGDEQLRAIQALAFAAALHRSALLGTDHAARACPQSGARDTVMKNIQTAGNKTNEEALEIDVRIKRTKNMRDIQTG
jgi:hypothetical protein